MPDELKQKLIGALGDLLEAVKVGAVFVEGQAPLVVQEYLRWSLWSNCVEYGLWVVLASLFVVVGGYIRKTYELYDTAGEVTTAHGVSWILTVVAGIILVPVTGMYLPTILKIVLAPRVYVLEWLASLVR